MIGKVTVNIFPLINISPAKAIHGKLGSGSKRLIYVFKYV